MRKIFTHLKSVVAFAIVAAMTLSVSCTYDDTALTNRVSKLEKDLAALTERVNALENNDAIKALVDGAAVVTSVETDDAGNTVITLSNGDTVTVLAECDALKYRVNDGVLEISADGETWVAVTTPAECVVKEYVVNADGSITITLADGTEFTVAVAELIECEAARGQVYVLPGVAKAVPFTVNDVVEDINVMNQPLGWSADVESVGGQNYVLNITGPAQDFVNAGYAAKEGVVSVHFNTAAGACKVMKVDVNLAELTLAIDADGNITITNSIACEQTNYWGEVFFDFADFWIGIMPKSLYDEHGKDALRNDFGSWDFNTAAATQRSSGLWNIADLQQYEEGVYEKELIEITVDQLATAFYPQYNFEVGGEYIIFLSTGTEMINYSAIPSLEGAVMASYKKVLISAEFVEGSTAWNDFAFKFSLAGFQYYLVGLLSDAEVQEYMSYGEYASVEDFIATYIEGYGLMSTGAIWSGDFIDQEIKASEFAQYSLTGAGPEVTANTEYHFYVYPFFAETEMDLYQHAVVAENLRYYGTFSTAALVAGEFEAAAEYELIEHVEDNISVEVTLGSDVTCAYYTWFAESQEADPVSASNLVLNDVYANYVQFDEYTTTIYAEKYGYYGLPNPIYLGIVAINANGEFVYVEKKFEYIEPEPIALVSWEYKGRHLDIDDNDETSGGDHVYVAKTVTGEELTFGLYYTLADENGNIAPGEYDYCANYFDAMYSYWNGFVYISDDYYSGSKMIVTEDTIKIKLKGGNIYLYDKNAAPAPAEPEVLVMDNVVRANYKNSKIQFFHQVDGANVYCAGFYNYDVVDPDKMFIPEGEYVVGYNFYVYGYSNVYDYVAKGYNYDFDEGGVMKVSEVNGAYHVEFSGTLNEGTVVLEFVYDGLIENLILPSEYKEPAVLDFVPVRAEYDNKFDLYEYNGGDAEYAYWLYDENNNYVEVIAHYNSNTGWDYIYDIKYVANGVEYVATKVTTIQKPNTWNCADGELYYSLAFSTEDYTFSYSGQLPSVEVNYLGSDATYAPGSENPGVGGGEDPVEPEPTEAIEMTMVSHAFGYMGSMETEVIFTDVDGNQHIVDFRMTGIQAGTYNSDNNGIILGFCRYMYGRSDFGGGVVFDSANGVITDNGDTTFTFDVNFVVEKVAYHFTYTTPKEEVNEDVTTVQLVSKSAGETISYGKAWTFSDAEGNNSVKLFVDEYYSYDSAADFPKANDYTTWQSSPSYVMTGSHFSFVNNSLVVNGVKYANSAVEAAALTVVEATSVTIEFTVEGNNYKFVYSI